jgi:PAS domain S-box-containing protein
MKTFSEINLDFRVLFESGSEASIILSPDLKILAVTNAYLKVSLTKREEIIGKNLFEVFPDNPNSSENTGSVNLTASISRVLLSKKTDVMPVQKYDVPLPEGGFEERYWTPKNTPVLDANQEVLYIIHQVEDVTLFVQKENRTKKNDIPENTRLLQSEKIHLQNLTDAQERLGLLLDNIKDYAIFMLDINGHILSWNNGAKQIKGYRAEEVLGKHISLFYTNADKEKNIPQKNLNTAKNNRYETEGWRIRKDGSTFWANIIFNPLYDEAGNLKGYAKITKDITDKKAAEDFLKESNEKFLKLFDYSPDAKCISVVENGKIIQVNAAFEELFEITGAEIIGKTAMDLKMISTEERTRIASLGKQNGNGQNIEVYMRTGRGRYKHIHVKTGIVELDGVQCFFSSYLDITERKEIEKKIITLNKELEQNVAELENVNRELESFSYSVSHDLRAPIRAIHSYSSILLNEYSKLIEPEAKESVDSIVRNAKKMGQLIDDLLLFSRVGKRDIQKSFVDVNILVHSILSDLTKTEPTNAEFIIHPLPSINADNNLLIQVFINLISNAIKYSQKTEKPIIEIGSFSKEQNLIYYVKDNGVGFDMKYYDKLFGVFQRLHSNAEYSGTGVGLALVKRIITRHGGEVWAEAKLNEGATFYFSLNK